MVIDWNHAETHAQRGDKPVDNKSFSLKHTVTIARFPPSELAVTG
jgi:hypothetical protein